MAFSESNSARATRLTAFVLWHSDEPNLFSSHFSDRCCPRLLDWSLGPKESQSTMCAATGPGDLRFFKNLFQGCHYREVMEVKDGDKKHTLGNQAATMQIH